MPDRICAGRGRRRSSVSRSPGGRRFVAARIGCPVGIIRGEAGGGLHRVSPRAQPGSGGFQPPTCCRPPARSAYRSQIALLLPFPIVPSSKIYHAYGSIRPALTSRVIVSGVRRQGGGGRSRTTRSNFERSAAKRLRDCNVCSASTRRLGQGRRSIVECKDLTPTGAPYDVYRLIPRPPFLVSSTSSCKRARPG